MERCSPKGGVDNWDGDCCACDGLCAEILPLNRFIPGGRY